MTYIAPQKEGITKSLPCTSYKKRGRMICMFHQDTIISHFLYSCRSRLHSPQSPPHLRTPLSTTTFHTLDILHSGPRSPNSLRPVVKVLSGACVESRPADQENDVCVLHHAFPENKLGFCKVSSGLYKHAS
jgi:hypothetical protein